MRHSIKHLLSSAFLLALTALTCLSCQQETELIIHEPEAGQLHSVRATMHVQTETFDLSLTRAGSEHQWQDGEMIYLLYTAETGTVGGNAVYSASDDVWTVNYYGRLIRDTQTKVQAYWFDGAGSSTESTVSLLPTTGIYADAEGSYVYPTGGDLTVTLSLKPQTSRIRFKGTSATNFSVGAGITTCTSYDVNKGALNTSPAAFDSKIASDGYSPYLYGVFTDSSNPNITIINDGRTYRTECPTTMFRVGESGWMNLPTLTSRNGWEMVVPITGLSLDQTTATVEPGSTLQLTATITPVDANNQTLSWTSSDTSIASVSATGLVTGIKEGTATITCSAQDGSGKSATCQVTVSNANVFTISSVTFKMIPVSGGTFTMGATSEQSNGYSPNSDESPTHQVTLSDYYIGETEVTQALWYAVMGAKPSSSYSWSSERGLGDNYPAYYISWEECQTFISKLNSMTGKTFRMPTEAEWEYAARGGNKSKGYIFSGSNTIDDVAWYTSNSGSKTHPVATKAPNELGIYDMSGNVWEWCRDWYGVYSSSAQTNPTGVTSGSYRVNRGGCWINIAAFCRVACRNYYTPSIHYYSLGLRLALSQ